MRKAGSDVKAEVLGREVGAQRDVLSRWSETERRSIIIAAGDYGEVSEQQDMYDVLEVLI